MFDEVGGALHAQACLHPWLLPGRGDSKAEMSLLAPHILAKTLMAQTRGGQIYTVNTECPATGQSSGKPKG